MLPLHSEHVRSVVWDIVWTLLTFGLYNLYVQYRQMLAVNAMLKQSKYSFLHWLFFSILTFGLYHIYHEYRKSMDIGVLSQKPDSYEPLLTVVLTAFGLHIVADAIQQFHINKFFGATQL